AAPQIFKPSGSRPRPRFARRRGPPRQHRRPAPGLSFTRGCLKFFSSGPKPLKMLSFPERVPAPNYFSPPQVSLNGRQLPSRRFDQGNPTVSGQNLKRILKEKIESDVKKNVCRARRSLPFLPRFYSRRLSRDHRPVAPV